MVIDFPPIIGQDDLAQEVNKMLTSLHNSTEGKFKGMEFYGLRGLGKSKILEEAKQHCRQNQWPWTLLVFPKGSPDNKTRYSILFNFCSQLEHDIPRILTVFMRTYEHRNEVFPSTEQDNLNEAMYNVWKFLSERLDGRPLIIIIDQTEWCPQEVFNWLGDYLLMGIDKSFNIKLGVFLAGNGPKVDFAGWIIRQMIESHRLDPLGPDETTKYLGNLKGGYQAAAAAIFNVSIGHPYSTQKLAENLFELGVKVDSVKNNRQAMAKCLLERVIERYILSDTEPWVLPLVRAASILREVFPDQVGQMYELIDKKSARSIDWYSLVLADLTRAPHHLFTMDGQYYRLDPTLQRLLHTALVILYPEETQQLHKQAGKSWENTLADPDSAGKYAIAVREVLYHALKVATIEESKNEENPDPGVPRPDYFQIAKITLSRLLQAYFKPQSTRDAQWLGYVKEYLEHDPNLNAFLQKDDIEKLKTMIDEFLTSASDDQTARKRPLSQVTIHFESPADYVVAWLRDLDVLIGSTEERTSFPNQIFFTEFRQDLRGNGRTAFRGYLPRRAQDLMRSQRGIALQLVTDLNSIPWELLHDDENFVCLNRPFARAPISLQDSRYNERPSDKPKRALVIGDPLDNLPFAREEAQQVAKLFQEEGYEVLLLIGSKEAKLNTFFKEIVNCWYDFIHFAGHGVFPPGAARQSALQFADGPCTAENFAAMLECSPFVFLNACDTMRTERHESAAGPRGIFIEGLATSALAGGAVGTLGPMWKTSDDESQSFAIDFYTNLLAGHTLGEAVRLARHAAIEKYPNSDGWAKWVLFGNPNLNMFPT